MEIQDRQHIEQVSSQDDTQTSAKAKGERLKRIRRLANLSREEFCTGEINITTLISWEVGRFGGLSVKGASRAISRVASEGVFCTPEWLLHGVGKGPEIREKLQEQPEDVDTNTVLPIEQDSIVQEVILFKKLNKHAIDYIVADDAMLPNYQIGDFVAGTKRFGDKIKSLISWDCIVQTNDGSILMRNLQPGPRENSFNLISTNLHTKTKNAILYDVILVVAAPVLWHRRKEPSENIEKEVLK